MDKKIMRTQINSDFIYIRGHYKIRIQLDDIVQY